MVIYIGRRRSDGTKIISWTGGKYLGRVATPVHMGVWRGWQEGAIPPCGFLEYFTKCTY